LEKIKKKERKADLRVYVMVVSHNDGFVVFYHQGYIRSTYSEYTLDNLDIPVHLTHT
jgi:hypothetical protein